MSAFTNWQNSVNFAVNMTLSSVRCIRAEKGPRLKQKGKSFSRLFSVKEEICCDLLEAELEAHLIKVCMRLNLGFCSV